MNIFKKNHSLLIISIIISFFILNAGDVSAAGSISSITIGSQNGVLTFGTNSNATYNVTFQGTNGAVVTPTVTGLPGGTKWAFNPSSITISRRRSVSATLTVTNSTSTPAGKTSFTVSAGGINKIGTFTVSQRPITVTADPKSKVSGALDPALTYQVTSGSLMPNDSFSGALTRTAGEAVGTYPILQGTLALGSNYNLTYINANFTITGTPVPTPTSTPANNLILNPSLENQSGSLPTSWQQGQWGNNTAVFTYPVLGTGAAGTKAVQVSITNYPSSDVNVGGDAKWYFNLVSVTPGQYYTFSDKYKSNITSHVVIEFHSSNNALTYQDIGTPGSASDWQTFSVGFSVPSNATSLIIYHLINAVGTLTTDDYSLVSSTNSNVLAKGIVSLSFDDNWASIYDNAIPILNAANFKSTQYIITDSIGDTADGYMTQAQVTAMYNQGQDIAAHTRTHPDLTTLSAANLQSEVQGSRTDLLNMSFTPVNSLAYPYGTYNSTVEQAVKNAGFTGARTVDSGFNDKSTNIYELKGTAVERGGSCDGGVTPTTLADVKGWVDSAALNKNWLILVFHQIDNVSANCYGTTPTMLQSIVDYLKTSNVNVDTVSQGLAQMTGQ